MKKIKQYFEKDLSHWELLPFVLGGFVVIGIITFIITSIG